MACRQEGRGGGGGEGGGIMSCWQGRGVEERGRGSRHGLQAGEGVLGGKGYEE